MSRAMRRMGKSSRELAKELNRLSVALNRSGTNAQTADRRVKGLVASFWSLRTAGSKIAPTGLTGIKQMGVNATNSERKVRSLAKTVWALRMTGGGITSLGLTGAMGAYPIARSIKQYANYEDALISIRKVWTGAQSDYDSLVNSLKGMNAQIPLSREAIAGLMEEGIRAKVSATDNPREYLDFTRLAAKFMVAFNLSATEAPQILAKLKSQLGLTAAEFEQFGDTLNTVANSFSTNEREMLEGMRRVGGLAKSIAGPQGVNDASAILGAQMAAGTPKEVAATGLRTLIARLSTQPSTTRKALKKLGFDPKEIKKTLPVDLFGSVYSIFHKMSKLEPSDRAGVLANLAGMKSFDAFSRLLARKDLLQQVKDVVDGDFRLTMVSEFERRIKGLNSLLQITKNVLQDAADSFVKQWRKPLTEGLAKIRGWAKALEGSSVVGWAAGFVALFSALSMVVVPLGVFAFSFKALLPLLALTASPIGVLIASAIGLGIAFSILDGDFSNFKNTASSAWDTSELKAFFDRVSELASSLSSRIGESLSSALESLVSDNPLARMFREALGVVTQILGAITELPNYLLNPSEVVKDSAKFIHGKVRSWFPDFKMPDLSVSKDRREVLSGGSLAQSQADKQMSLKVQTDNQVTIDAPGTIILKLPDGTVAGSIPLKGSVVSKGITTPDAVGP
jgi:TP901 family phage tail tape measure protein